MIFVAGKMKGSKTVSVAGSGEEGLARKPINKTSWMTVVTLTHGPKSVHNFL